ncbi:hypothetical protein MMC10_004731 [Thelotrema lepadinum]|nr:hypothetical protein [Thelotrema lepadinum]
MCFFKKPKPFPPVLDISAPIARPFDYEKASGSKVSTMPSEGSESKSTVFNGLTQPPKVYAAKPLEEPITPWPNAQPTWNVSRSLSQSMTRTSSTSSTFSTMKKDLRQTQKKPSFWLRRQKLSKATLFRNKGLDENGRLKPEFEEIRDTEWGEPDEWLPTERRPRYLQ